METTVCLNRHKYHDIFVIQHDPMIQPSSIHLKVALLKCLQTTLPWTITKSDYLQYIAPFSHPFHWRCQTCTAGGWNIQPARSMAMKRTSSSKTRVSQQTDLFLSGPIHVWTFGNPASSLDPNLSSDLSENVYWKGLKRSDLGEFGRQ